LKIRALSPVERRALKLRALKIGLAQIRAVEKRDGDPNFLGYDDMLKIGLHLGRCDESQSLFNHRNA
jgi:hypothetical protein